MRESAIVIVIVTVIVIVIVRVGDLELVGVEEELARLEALGPDLDHLPVWQLIRCERHLRVRSWPLEFTGVPRL